MVEDAIAERCLQFPEKLKLPIVRLDLCVDVEVSDTNQQDTIFS